MSLGGRVALVTGAGGGIGFGIAAVLAAAGARVAINDIDAGAAGRAAGRLGGGAFTAAGDVSDPAAVEAIITETLAVAGGLDILVNNAGLGGAIGSMRRQDPTEWQQIMDVNLRGPFLMSRAATGALRRSAAGVIVNIASIAGLVGFPGSHGYGVSKAGVAMLTRTLATELARHGIRVNAVAPGIIDAPMFYAMTEDGAHHERFVSRVPLGRLGTAYDIGNAVAFLASDAASYVTGAILPVDGGWTAFGGAGAASAAGGDTPAG